ncbi:TPA: hypothetical protein DIC39_00445 [Patescibacteria group bacterium]|nr:hypothetical protein [Patescibacteria group bacterium]HCU47522.1 hypothetical protein [Patescibacteria group bacterium]
MKKLPLLLIGSSKVRGFTLMEVLVVMFIFTLASLLIAEIFVNVQRAQQNTRDAQIAYTDARYLLEVLSREIRASTIAYGEYPSSTPESVETVLHLTSGEGKVLSFRHDTAACPGVPCVTIERDLGGESVISSPNLSVDKLEFYITPLADPFPDTVTVGTPDIQPQVTIVLKTSSLNIKIQEQKPIYLQTTVASRVYKR